ncbi:MAG: hypothetical protein Q4G63_02965 [Bacteroidia bacterium]|nr:hypothetical protein [Bacteroidia bacterium]
MKADKILLSRWLMIVLFALAFIMPPFASQNFETKEIGNIVVVTLSNSFVKNFIPYSTVFQLIALFFLMGIAVWKNRFAKAFSLFAGFSFLAFTLVQNMAITEKFGFRAVISNLILMSITSFVWFRDTWKDENRYTFANFGKKNAWLLVIALFCFWWPMNFSGELDFNPLNFFTGHVVQALQFCPMTPIFLIILIFCKSTISLPIYRITGISGTIIGFWNMMNFFNPSTLYVGVYHLPLFLISLYVLIDSFKLRKNYVQRT